MFEWIKNLKKSQKETPDIPLDQYLQKLSPAQLKEIELKVLPDMVKRINELSKSDTDFRLHTMNLINKMSL